MNRSGKLHALLSTARVANIPSVVSNVWVGVAMVLVSGIPTMGEGIGWSFLQLSFAGVSLYVSGNFFNDWMDRDWDALHRPERALPSGHFAPSTYLVVAVLLAVLGIAIAACANLQAAMVAGLIVSCIGIYTWSHKKTTWSVIPMGLCRALLPLMGALGVVAAPAVIPALLAGAIPAASLFCYIIGLSLVARSESLPGKPKNPSKGLLVVPVALALLIFVETGGRQWLLLSGILPYVVWMAVCDLVRIMKGFRFVSFLLGGIPLVDWVFLLPIGLMAIVEGEGTGALGIACLLMPPLAFISALLLQRLAPAT